MPLSSRSKSQLDTCAVAVMLDRQLEIDLSVLNNDATSDEEIVAYLAEQVELMSNSQLTVRPADTALFAHRVQGRYWYLTRCPGDTPAGLVTILTDDMCLLGVGPYRSGLRLHETLATPDQVAEARARAARYSEEQAKNQVVQEAVQARVEITVDTLQRLAARHEDTRYIYIGDDPSISKIIEICHRTGMPLEEFFRTVLSS